MNVNVDDGRCEACKGDGIIKIEHFLPDVYVTCDVCKGLRYNRDTLEIRYRGKNIADVLDSTLAILSQVKQFEGLAKTTFFEIFTKTSFFTRQTEKSSI
jgi:excinuclease UvrABC ATPase subunit